MVGALIRVGRGEYKSVGAFTVVGMRSRLAYAFSTIPKTVNRGIGRRNLDTLSPLMQSGLAIAGAVAVNGNKSIFNLANKTMPLSFNCKSVREFFRDAMQEGDHIEGSLQYVVYRQASIEHGRRAGGLIQGSIIVSQDLYWPDDSLLILNLAGFKRIPE